MKGFSSFHSVTLGILAVAALLGQSVTPEESGSISGTVVHAATGRPIPDVPLVVHRSENQPSARTDAQGHYILKGVRPGRYSVGTASLPGEVFSATRLVNVAAGEHVRSIDFRVYPNQSVSGRVLDEEDEPLSGVEVVLLGREYYMGELRYYRYGIARTNEQGEYRIERNVPPGIGWLVWARPLNRDDLPTASDVPEDPELREQATVPTYYPNATTAEQATVVILGAGEQREGVDIRVARLPSYCLEAQIDMGEEKSDTKFWIQGVQPSFRFGPTGGVTGTPPGGQVGPVGRIRICDLWPADYRLTAMSGDPNAPDSFGTTLVSIKDADVSDVSVVVEPRLPLSGRVTWAADPPERLTKAALGLRLNPLHRTSGRGGQAPSTIPGRFLIQPDPVMDEYAIWFFPELPTGVYGKDVTYGGVSVLNRPLTLNSLTAGFELHVIADHDGGTLTARVTDDEGHPIGNATVVLMPKKATTYLRLAETRVAQKTDQNGECISPSLPPGSYLVLATEDDFTDSSPETISTLFAARLKAEEIEIGPNEKVEVSLKQLGLGR